MCSTKTPKGTRSLGGQFTYFELARVSLLDRIEETVPGIFDWVP